MWQLSLEETF